VLEAMLSPRFILKASATMRQAASKAISTSNKEASEYIVRVKDAKSFVEECMIAVGTKKPHAQSLASVLILADQRGHYSHGLNRLGASSPIVQCPCT